MKKGLVIILILLFIVLIILGVMAGKKVNNVKNNEGKDLHSIGNVIQDKVQQSTEEEQVQIFKGNTRPIAVMIDNVGSARPQAGLNEAYLVYEIIVEGNLTRLMTVYKDADLEKIGPVRSARHYFLDYALENDAIYVHFGWSPQAQADIGKLRVDNINGMVESSKSFSI